MPPITRCLTLFAIAIPLAMVASAQEGSVNPGINDVFEKQPHAAQAPEIRTRQGAGRGLGRDVGSAPGRGPGQGAGRGAGRGPRPEMRADQEVLHFLLQNHTKIRRQVERRDNGVETLTESDDLEVAKKIQEHVAAMHQRVKEGRGLRFWDNLFVALFERSPSIEMTVENTEQGVRVRESSDDPATVVLIQAHADVVSKFVELGFEEAHRNHPVPAADAKEDQASDPSGNGPAAKNR